MNLKRISLCLAVAQVLSACQTIDAYKADKSVKADASLTSSQIKEHSRMTPSATAVSVVDELWVTGASYRLTDKDTLPAFFNGPAPFYQATPVSFQEMISLISGSLGQKMVVSPDASAFLQGGSSSASGSSTAPVDQATEFKSAPQIPNEFPLPGGKIISATQTPSFILPGQNIKFSLRHEGTVASLLDQVTAKVGLSWRWDGSRIVVFRNETKTFVIDALAGKTAFNAEVSSSKTGAGGTTGSNASSLSSHSTKIEAAPKSVWETLEGDLKGMISPDGNLQVSEDMGAVTVTDTPQALERIAEHIEHVNEIIGKRIAIRAEVYEINMSATNSAGIDWNLIFTGSDTYKVSLKSVFGQATDSPSLNMGIISPTSRFSGSQAFLNALGKYTNVSLKTSSSAFTTNGQSVPIQIVDEIHYIESVSSQESTTSGIAPTVTITPGVTTQGYSMNVMPKITSAGNVMMQVSVDMSTLNELKEVKLENVQVQLPNRSTKTFMQRVGVGSGETLMISGFERTEDSSGAQGTFGPSAWFAGGTKGSSKKHLMTMILLTPYIMAD